MTKSAHSVHRDLAWALKQQAKRAGERAPSVRGADWRLATVTSVNSGGTVIADGIACRRMDTYTNPAINDVIVITQSSSGNWLAVGRTAAPSATSSYQTGSLTMSWSSASSAQQNVTFPVPFAVAPNVMLNIATGDGAVARWSGRAYQITATGFIAFIYAPTSTATSSGTNIPIQWIAVAP